MLEMSDLVGKINISKVLKKVHSFNGTYFLPSIASLWYNSSASSLLSLGLKSFINLSRLKKKGKCFHDKFKIFQSKYSK